MRGLIVVLLAWSLAAPLVGPGPLVALGKSMPNDWSSQPENNSSLSSPKAIGFCTAGVSEYAAATIHLLHYTSFGAYLRPFDSFADLDQFTMIIVPERTWQDNEIAAVASFLSAGGVALLTGRVSPPLSLTRPVEAEQLTLEFKIPYSTISSTESTAVSYYKAYYRMSTTSVDGPTASPRPVLYYPTWPPNATVIAWASDQSHRLGAAVISRYWGRGLLVLCGPTLFDLMGQLACGAPPGSSPDRYGLAAGWRVMDLLGQLVAETLLRMGRPLPLRWAIPDGYWNVVFTRDDMDFYFENMENERGRIDQQHGLRCIFNELDDLVKNWSFLGNGYHYPGYHRHSMLEPTAASYLRRLQDIQNATGRPVLFECHHGVDSGWTGQPYVETAATAAEAIGHWVVYTSGEGSYVGYHLYPLPYLVRRNGVLEPTTNYFAFPATQTLDWPVKNFEVDHFCAYLRFCMAHHLPIFWLLHSCNLGMIGLDNYDRLLNCVDMLVPKAYHDPEAFIRYNLLTSANVRATYQYNTSCVITTLAVNQSILGYSVLVPKPLNSESCRLYLDGQPLTQFDEFPLAFLSCLLFACNLTVGTHQLTLSWTPTRSSSDDTRGIRIVSIALLSAALFAAPVLERVRRRPRRGQTTSSKARTTS
jgi:hypothetical protein